MTPAASSFFFPTTTTPSFPVSPLFGINFLVNTVCCDDRSILSNFATVWHSFFFDGHNDHESTVRSWSVLLLVASSVTSSSPSFFFGTPLSYGFPSSFGFGNAASSSSSTPDVVLESVKLGKAPELPGEAEEVAATDAKADFADEDEEEDVAPKTRAEEVDTAEAEACEENNAGTDEGGLNEILLNIYSPIGKTYAEWTMLGGKVVKKTPPLNFSANSLTRSKPHVGGDWSSLVQ
ncbi:hypothetical protein MRB53_019159 [Persea americana]|uniref:Uncharacterized protein n=1 Tax=Persea americana TaxID=3435 RepID=A0ACC2M9Z7_PERAE|nr:hypothetical protein MRB53_019159 [Persea americana]